MELKHIDIACLSVSPANMRGVKKQPDLTNILPSVRARGILVPLIVRQNGSPTTYEIVAGKRRYHAALAVAQESGGIDPLPCAVMEAGGDAAALEASLIENIARLDPDEVTRWESFTRLVKEGRSPEDIALTFGLTSLQVKRTLALGNLLPRTVSHADVLRLVDENCAMMPVDLNGWRRMFADIYPRSINAPTGFSSVALFEELGELAEAIRVYDRYPHYFYGEAADVFSYIMGIANEYALTLDDEAELDLQAEYVARYPGLCINCGSRSCMCPAVPKATVGRMAKELNVDMTGRRIDEFDAFAREGEAAAKAVFEGSGFDPRVARRLPFDRGDLNVALTQLSFRLANALEQTDSGLAGQLRHEALAIDRAERGTASRDGDASSLMMLLRRAWGEARTDVQRGIRAEDDRTDELTHLFEKRVLVVTANPDGETGKALRIDKEIRAIKGAFNRTPGNVHVEPLTAATIDDLRRALLNQQFDIIHFAGHAEHHGISLLDEAGTHHQATFTRRDLAMFVHSHSDGKDQYDAAMTAVRNSPDIIALGKDGRGEERFTSRDMIETEQRLQRAAGLMAERERHRVNDAHRDAADDLGAAFERSPELVREAADGRTQAALQAMQMEAEIRNDPFSRADRFVEGWQQLQQHHAELVRDGNFRGAKTAAQQMTRMTKSLERDAQLESVLGMRSRDLGLERSENIARSLSRDLASSIPHEHVRGISRGMSR